MFYIILAYLMVDAIGGVYHWMVDRGYGLRQQVTLFARHHDENTMTDFDWQTFAVGLPFMVVGAWFHSPFWVVAGFFGVITQCTHYYAHRRSSVPLIYHVVRVLQISGVIIRPSAHQRHHSSGRYDRDFCLLSGWNNFWLNPVLQFLDRRMLKT